jgi:hypothetical protein
MDLLEIIAVGAAYSALEEELHCVVMATLGGVMQRRLAEVVISRVRIACKPLRSPNECDQSNRSVGAYFLWR